MENYRYIKENYLSLKDEIAELSARLGMPEPTLVAVTKSGTDEELLALAAAGAADIGENRPGELKRRADILRASGFYPNMHEIGTLQRNKIKLIIEDAHLVHSLDTPRLAKDLARHAEALGRRIPVLIEINSAKEAQKGGILPSEAEEFLASLSEYGALIPSGLMTMGPAVSDPEELRPYFRETRRLFERLLGKFEAKEPILSMGMSDSYKLAIEEGSTLVRVGRKLFRKNESEE